VNPIEGAGSPHSVSEALADRLATRWREGEWLPPGSPLVVAVSGGLDSTVLLHLLRFSLAEMRLKLTAAHFDHGMRSGSQGDARWVAGLTGAWGVPLRTARAPVAPGSEAEARRSRYEFLHRIRVEVGATALATAHHADDQVETILFRVLRGTGIHGLGGIRQRREPGVLRPLLDEPRDILEAYAAARGLRGRMDPTNQSLTPARNRLRHDLIPRLLQIHPGARESLLRLGRNARRTQVGLERLLEPHLNEVIEDRRPGFVSFGRDAFLSWPPEVQGLLLRRVLDPSGAPLSEAGTSATLEFIRIARSGARLELAGGRILRRSFDSIEVEWGLGGSDRGIEDESPDRTLTLDIPPASGAGSARIAGREIQVEWRVTSHPRDLSPTIRGEGEEEGGSAHGPVRRGLQEGIHEASFPLDQIRLPLTLRRWQPGDRVRTRAGSRKLKKIFGDLRIPAHLRSALVLIVDDSGTVLWIPGWFRGEPLGDREVEGSRLTLQVGEKVI
jgi:tRNA(Ile)-lysidine synthase